MSITDAEIDAIARKVAERLIGIEHEGRMTYSVRVRATMAYSEIERTTEYAVATQAASDWRDYVASEVASVLREEMGGK